MNTKVNNLKHKDDWLRYQENKTIFSAPYKIYIMRVMRYGQTREQAIESSPKIRKPNLIKTRIDDQGRECTLCYTYKTRSDYHRSKNGVLGYTNNCRDCRNESRRKIREKTNSSRDKEYELRKRTLQEGEIIAMREPVIYEDNPREDKYRVLGYQKGKGYTIKSLLHGGIIRIVTGNNKNSPNNKKFYRIKDESVQEVKTNRNMDNYFTGIPC